MKNFVETYASFKDVGGYASIGALEGFKGTVSDRMGIKPEVYDQMALPIMTKIMTAEAMARAPSADPAVLAEWGKKATAGVYLAMGGKMADLAPGANSLDAAKMGLAQKVMAGVSDAGAQIKQMAALPADRRNDAAYGWMRGAIQADLDRARQVMVGDPTKTEAYSPPAVTQRVINGLVEKSKFVSLKVLATAVDASDVQ